jgi:hypothetical protein
MLSTNSVRLTLQLKDSTMTREERHAATCCLLQQLKGMDEVNSVRLVEDPHSASDRKGASTLMGLLSAEATVGNACKVLGFMGDRWGDKPIELEIEVNGRKLRIVARSREEFAIAQAVAQKFMAEQDAISDRPQTLTQPETALK